MNRILDPKFKYVKSDHTDIAKTFKRIRAEQKKNAEERAVKVEPFPQRRKA